MKLTIIGASGHGKVAADIAKLNGYDEIEFLDDNTELRQCGRWPVVGTTDDAERVDGDLFIAIGNTAVRRRLMEKFGNKNIITLVHPSTVIAEDVEIGTGTIVAAGAVINPGARIGIGCIINTCSSVDHDCLIGDYVHVAVGGRIAGTVRIGESTWIGTGAVVINNISICHDCTVGAGAAVIGNIETPGTYVGVPAKRIK